MFRPAERQWRGVHGSELHIGHNDMTRNVIKNIVMRSGLGGRIAASSPAESHDYFKVSGTVKRTPHFPNRLSITTNFWSFHLSKERDCKHNEDTAPTFTQYNL
jgi:hypothetical protein